MVILYFFGPDGAGKSTLTKAMAKTLYVRGYKVKTSWMRGSHTFASITAKMLSKFDFFKGSQNPYFNIRIPPKMKRFWQFLEFLSAIPVILYRFVIPSFLGYYVIADRYTSDLSVWLCLTTNDYGFLNTFESKVLVTLSSKASSKFYVTATIDDLTQRTDKLWFVKEQLGLYSKISKMLEANIINTSILSKKDSFEEALTIINAQND